ncbi:MAG: sugar phosphate isomerase/epimerase [Clostridia bacterium]|nr:sugar phosphate isomerase/epimerase [Clostridia bacterium]
MKLGAQLYTVRDYCKDLDYLEETLKKVAEIGYKYVQLSGVCDYTTEWINEKLEKYGLIAPLTHFDTEKIINETEKTIDFHKSFNCDYIGIGWYDFNQNSIDDFASKFDEAIKQIAKSDLSLCYHNHDPEFQIIDGKTILDLICERYSADELKITVDTYWVQAGGADPAQILRKLNGRIPCIHLKDMGYQRTMLPVGSGNMNFHSIVEAAKSSGVEYAFVEQDNCNGEDPFECLKKSFDYCVNTLGIEV